MDFESDDSGHHGISGQRPMFGNLWTRRVLFYGLPTVLVLLLFGVIGVSRLNVDESLQVFGDGEDAGKSPSVAEGESGKRNKGMAPITARMRLKTGGRAALRAVVVRRLRNTYLKPLKAHVRLRRSGRTWSLFKGDSAGMDVLSANFRLPDLAEGRYRLEVSVAYPAGKKKALIPVTVSKALPVRELRSVDPPQIEAMCRKAKPDDDDVVVELLPSAGRRVVAELPQTFYLRARKSDGTPVALEARIALLKGLVGRTGAGQLLTGWKKTDDAGLITYNLMSRHPFLELGVEYRLPEPPAATTDATGPAASAPSAQPATRRRRFAFAVRPAQSVLKVRSPAVLPGGMIVVEAQTLLPSGVLHLDGFWKGNLIFASSRPIAKGKTEFRLKAPREEGLLHLQAYYDLADPGLAVTTLNVFVTRLTDPAARGARVAEVVAGRLGKVAAKARKKESEEKILKIRLAARGAALSAEADMAHVKAIARANDRGVCVSEKCVRYLLSRLDNRFYPPRMLANTIPGELKALAARKSSTTILLMVLFAVGALGLMAVLAVVIHGHMKTAREAAAEQQRLMEEFEREQERGGPEERHGDVWHTDLGGKTDDPKWVRAIQVGAMVGVILFTVAAVVALLTTLLWEI